MGPRVELVVAIIVVYSLYVRGSVGGEVHVGWRGSESRGCLLTSPRRVLKNQTHADGL